MDKRPIILIDDDVDDLTLYKDVLVNMQLDREILIFERAREALEYLTIGLKHPFLIFCDINMPMINGMELRQKLVKSEHLRKKTIPFLFLSTSGDQHQVKGAYALSIQGYFEKPQSYQGVIDLFRCVVDYWSCSLHPGL